MISVKGGSRGSRDGRKGTVLGFENGDMEETELEEGEAPLDRSIDPDALSYIDLKIQDVLGHFQKDFEGGVSAENLGPKFGGYGSFLPAYQRSPSWFRPRTPPEVLNQSRLRSPNNVHLEFEQGYSQGGWQNSVSASHNSLSARPCVPSSSGPDLKAASGNEQVNQGAGSNNGDELTSKVKLEKLTNFSDQKALKFRIKVGVDNFFTRKNAEIYSGLGLDVSPSSSLDNTTDSEGFYHDLQDMPDESPTSILQIMTSIRSFGGSLLSPLSDDVTQLTENKGIWLEALSKIAHKSNLGSSKLIVSGSDLTTSGERKPKLSEESPLSVEPSNNSNKVNRSGLGSVVKKDEIDDSACEELVSNALKLPLLSNSLYDVHSAKDAEKSVVMRNSVKSLAKNDSLSNVVEEVLLEPLSQNVRVEKSNGNVKKPNFVDESSVHQTKTESNVSEERKSVKFDDLSKQKNGSKVASHSADALKSAHRVMQSSSGDKKNSKGSQRQYVSGIELQENGSVVNYSAVSNSKKISGSDSQNKGHGNASDKYKEFFGDLEIEQDDEEIASEEMTSVQRVKDSELAEKRGISECNIANDGLNDTMSHPKLASHRPPLNGKWLNHDAVTSMLAPLDKEDWVCCDKCQAWRLLPLGKNPDSLPEKWLCSMLDWLPGMNRCSISEEETTNALRALSQAQASVVPLSAASGSQLDQHAHPGRAFLGVSPGDSRRSSDDCHNSGSQGMAFGGRRKSGSKDVTNTTSQDGPMQSSNLKKNLQEFAKSRNLGEVDHSSVQEFGFQFIGEPSGSFVDRYAVEKEKRVLDMNSDEGDEMKSKMKERRENDVNVLRAPKKMKMENERSRDENPTSDPGGSSSKPGRSSNSASGKDSRRFSNSSKENPKKKWSLSCEKLEVRTPINVNDPPLPMEISGNDGSVKKRKGNEHQNSDVGIVPLQSSQLHFQGSRTHLEDAWENECRKEKKARVSKSEGKDSSGNKGRSVSAIKGKSMTEQKTRRDLDCTQSRRSMDAANILRRDSVSGQPSVAANSSSSKVSGSRKSKTSLQEMKGSPVESVSSSPLRISNTDKLTQVRNNAIDNSLDRDDTGVVGDQSGKMIDSSHNSIHRESVETMVLDFQGRDMDHGSGVGKLECVSSTDFLSYCEPDCKINAVGLGSQKVRQRETSEQIQTVGKRNDHQSPSNGPNTKKFEKGSSAKSKEKILGSVSGLENCSEASHEENMKPGRDKFLGKASAISERSEKKFVSKNEYTGKPLKENCKVENQPKVGAYGGSIIGPDAITGHDMKQNVSQDSDNNRSSRKSFSDKSSIEVTGRGKSHSLPPSIRGQIDTVTHLWLIAEYQKENGEYKEHDSLLKASKQSKKAEKQNGNQNINLRHPTPPLHRSRDVQAPSPVRKDSSSQAVTNAVKEAKDLKHLADRYKNSGSTESTGLYFQAALKFLHGASFLESGGSENTKHNLMIQSMQMYSSTAKLCEFCAHEFEKSKDMAAAALAYKCMEVAYMRVVYASHNSANRDRNDLLAALQISPTGESPSSSASDIDNLNNPVTVDKTVQAKSAGSPQVTGNHVLTARTRSGFMRLINYAQDVNNAMEASRKSRNAFAAAKPRSDGSQHKEGISSVKKALDFNFQDVDGLLCLVRVAMEQLNGDFQ